MTDAAIMREDDIKLQLRVLRCQAGDEQAFRDLLDDFGPRTLRYLRGLVGDDAEDVYQEVWFSVYRSIATLAKPAVFRTWLYSTTRRRAIDQLRRQSRERTLLVDVVDDVREVVEVSGGSAPELDEEKVERALTALPVTQREVVLLHYRDGMTYAEIAVIVGRPIGTIRSRLHHGKLKLRELLQRGDS